jgi:hypothetical protein
MQEKQRIARAGNVHASGAPSGLREDFREGHVADRGSGNRAVERANIDRIHTSGEKPAQRGHSSTPVCGADRARLS